MSAADFAGADRQPIRDDYCAESLNGSPSPDRTADRNKLREDERVELIRSVFADNSLHRDITAQIDQILKEQFSPAKYAEVGGGIFRSTGGLDLEVVQTEFEKMVTPAVKAVEERRDPAAAGILRVELLERYQRLASDELGECAYSFLLAKLVLTSLEWETVNIKPATFTVALDFIKEIARAIYLPTGSEERINAENFVGRFHVHPSPNGPSRNDLDTNREDHLPDLIISADRDYKSSGMTIYLVHHESFEMLYKPCASQF